MKNTHFQSLRNIILPMMVLLFPAASLSTPFGAGIVEAAILLVALLGARQALTAWRSEHAFSDAFRGFAVLWLASIALELFLLSVHGFSGSRLHSPLLRLGALLAAIVLLQDFKNTRLYWYGLIVGCYAVLVVALVQRYGLQLGRSNGFHNAIHFGNFSLALGLMALVAVTQLENERAGFRWLLAGAALAGLLTSVLSGSRGGWVGLLLAFIPLYRLSRDKRRMVFVALGSMALLAALYLVPASGVKERVDGVWTNLQAYAKGDVHTSIGMRFELFQASWKVFLNHPMLGVGDDFKPALAEMVKAGVEIKPSYQLNDTHNEVLYALMRGGVVGLGQLLLVYLAPMVYFSRTLRRSVSGGAPILRAFAAAGLLLVLMTIDFGLSVNVFTRHIGKAFYFVTVCFLIAFCEIERRRPQRSASDDSLVSHA